MAYTPPAIGQLLQYNGTNIVGSPLLRGYIDGLTLIPNSGTIMQINPGIATDSTAVSYISLSAVTLKGTASWAPGTGNGGLLDAGAISASATTYHWYLISQPNGGSPDVGFSTSLTPTLPSLPSAYTLSRRIMSTMWTGTAWILFTQNGDEVLYAAVINDGTSLSCPTTPGTLYTLTVPTGIQVTAIVNLNGSSSTVSADFYFSSPDQNDEAVAVVTPVRVTFRSPAAANNSAYGQARIRTNTAAQIRGRCSGASASVDFGTMGYVHPRGRNQ